MKLTRIPLALLALAAFTTAFAGDAGSPPAPHAPACQEASCTMDMAKVVREAPTPAATGSWYLPTWEEATAASNGGMACGEVRSTVAPAETTTTSWYLPTAEEGAGTATAAMACCETPCPMEQASHAKPAPAETSVDSWYLPS